MIRPGQQHGRLRRARTEPDGIGTEHTGAMLLQERKLGARQRLVTLARIPVEDLDAPEFMRRNS